MASKHSHCKHNCVTSVSGHNFNISDHDQGTTRGTNMIEARTGRKKSGGAYCAAVKCSNNQQRDQPRGIHFYRFPVDPTRRERWLVRVNRREPSGALWTPGSSARLCSAHFVSGRKSDDPNDIDYLPAVFPTGHVRVHHNPERAERMRRRSLGQQSSLPKYLNNEYPKYHNNEYNSL